MTTSGALTQDFCYRAAAVAPCGLLRVRMLAGTSDDEAAQHDSTTGINRASCSARSQSRSSVPDPAPPLTRKRAARQVLRLDAHRVVPRTCSSKRTRLSAATHLRSIREPPSLHRRPARVRLRRRKPRRPAAVRRQKRVAAARRELPAHAARTAREESRATRAVRWL